MSRAPVSALALSLRECALNESGIGHNLAELIRQRARSFCTRRAREDVGIWIVACRKRGQIVDQRLHERDHNSPPRLACGKRNLARFQINCAPRELCQIAEPLPEIHRKEPSHAIPRHRRTLSERA